MPQLGLPAPKPTAADIRKQVRDLKDCYGLMKDRNPIPSALLQSLPSIPLIQKNMGKLKPSDRPDVDFETLEIFVPSVVRYAVTQMLRDVENANSIDEKSGNYYHLDNFMTRFKLKPDDYLSETPSATKRENAARVFKEGSLVFARRSLMAAFELAPVSEADMAILKDKNASPNDRLNALLRPLKYKDFMTAMNALEGSGHSFDEPDFVDDIIPANVFNRVAVPEIDTDRQRNFDQMRNEILTRLKRVVDALSTREQSKFYSELVDVLAKHKMTPQEFVLTNPLPEWQEVMLENFKAGAAAYARVHLENVLNVHPLSAEDQVVIRNPDAGATDKINILFRHSSNGCIRVLNALEDAGFDFEDASWIGRIIPANATFERKQDMLPVLSAK